MAVPIRLLESIAVDLRQIFEWGQRPIGTAQRLAALGSMQTLRNYLAPQLRKAIGKAASEGADRDDLLDAVTLEVLLTFEDYGSAWMLINHLGVDDDLFEVIPQESTI